MTVDGRTVTRNNPRTTPLDYGSGRRVRSPTRIALFSTGGQEKIKLSSSLTFETETDELILVA